MKRYLLPYPYKFAGIILAGSGLILGVLYLFFELRINLTVFAIASTFLKNEYFTLIHTNVADEMAMIALLIGLSLMALSKERSERDHDDQLRIKALVHALRLQIILVSLSILLVYGTAFIMLLVFNMYACLLFYYLLFLLFRKRYRTSAPV